MERPTQVSEPAAQVDSDPTGLLEQVIEPDYVEDELLVEEISIDGMCGVY